MVSRQVYRARMSAGVQGRNRVFLPYMNTDEVKYPLMRSLLKLNSLSRLLIKIIREEIKENLPAGRPPKFCQELHHLHN